MNAFFKSPRSLVAPKNVTAASRLHRSTVAFCRKTGFIVSVQPHKDCVSPLNAHVSFCVKLRQQFQFRRNLFFFIYTTMFYVYLYIVYIQNTSSFFFLLLLGDGRYFLEACRSFHDIFYMVWFPWLHNKDFPTRQESPTF